MKQEDTFFQYFSRRGVSRRAFLRFCAVTASAMALPAGAGQALAAALTAAPRPSVLWLSFQECTGCSESLTRSGEPTIEGLMLDHLSLDYHHLLQAAAGEAAEEVRLSAMAENAGSYVLVVDGSVPTGAQAAWSTIAGVSNLQMLTEMVDGAALVIAVGTCASFGGIPAAAAICAESLSQSGATGVGELMDTGVVATRPLVNVPGCPPLPEVISGTIAYFLAYGAVPEMDALRRPTAWFGKTVHDGCPRRHHFTKGHFALAYDDAEASRGYCLYKLGCRGPETYNACPSLKWNLGTSFPMHSGHGCLGCSMPGFWDRALAADASGFTGSGFYPDAPPMK